MQAVNAPGAELRIAGFNLALRGDRSTTTTTTITKTTTTTIPPPPSPSPPPATTTTARTTTRTITKATTTGTRTRATTTRTRTRTTTARKSTTRTTSTTAISFDLSSRGAPRRARAKPAMRNSAPRAFTACTEGRMPLTPAWWAACISCPHGRQLAAEPPSIAYDALEPRDGCRSEGCCTTLRLL